MWKTSLFDISGGGGYVLQLFATSDEFPAIPTPNTSITSNSCREAERQRQEEGDVEGTMQGETAHTIPLLIQVV